MSLKHGIPRVLRPLARHWYWYFRYLGNKWASPGLSTEERKRLPALRCSVAYNRYGGYCVPEDSWHRLAARKTLARDVHEAKTLAYIREHCGDGDIVHAGAFFGDFLPALDTMIAAHARVYAFEPAQENYRCSLITLILNDIDRVSLYQAALDAQTGHARLQTVDAEGWALGGASTLIHSDCGNQSHYEEVRTLTIDSVVPPERLVSIIHLDTEGYEKQALMGAVNTIERWRPILILERWKTGMIEDDEWFQQTVMSLGYQHTATVDENQVFTCPSL